MRITRLGQGVDATGRLDPEAIERTLDVLREFRQAMDEHGVERVRMTATSAARDAGNRDEFFGAAEQIVGTRPELLSGDEEGRLASRRHRRARSGRRPVPGGRHRWRIDRVRRRHRPSPRRVSHRRRMRAAHREVPPPTRRPPRSCRRRHRRGVPQGSTTCCGSCRPPTRRSTFVGLAGTVTTVGRGRDGAGRVRPRPHPPLRLTRPRPRTCSARWPPSALADRIHNPGLEQAGPTSSSAAAACSSPSCGSLEFDELLVSEATSSTASSLPA